MNTTIIIHTYVSNHRESKKSVRGAVSTSHVQLNQCDTRELHTFIKDTFPGALLLEEHQVTCIIQSYIYTCMSGVVELFAFAVPTTSLILHVHVYTYM